jgi:hypothetical protein
MTLGDDLQTVRTFGELRLVLLRAKRTPRVLDFMAFTAEQAESRRRLHELHDVELADLQKFISVHHREIDALAEAANVGSFLPFLLAVARCLENEDADAL